MHLIIEFIKSCLTFSAFHNDIEIALREASDKTDKYVLTCWPLSALDLSILRVCRTNHLIKS